jgi:hypothetical protein
VDGGTYDIDASSSFQFVNNNFSVRYLDNRTTSGVYAPETFQTGGTLASIDHVDGRCNNKSLEFGVGLTSSASVAVMDIGYDTREAITFLNLSSYPNLIDQMVSQGLVQSRTYPLYLNDLEASTGTIFFGGVDLEGFSRTHQTLPINPPSQGPLSQFFITLTGINLTPPCRTPVGLPLPCGRSTPVGLPSSFPANANLDSSTTFMLFPTAIADTIAAGLGAVMDDFGIYNLPNCDLQFADGSLGFDFSG